MIRIGFITDLSGPYAGLDGQWGAEAIRMAINDMGGAAAGKPVELLVADHRNDRGTAAGLAREWFDIQGLDVLIGGVNSNTSLVMADVARERRRPFLAVGSGNTAHTREQRSAYTVHYAYDTDVQGRVAGHAFAGEGSKGWFFVAADYAFGRQLQHAAVAAVEENGGQVVGTAEHPYAADDVGPAIQQAVESGADVIGLANSHADAVKSVLAVRRSAGGGTMRIASTFLFIDEVHDIGLEAAQGMRVADSWFWTHDAETRAWGRRFFGTAGRMPSSLHAADYSACLQYLRAVDSIGSTEPDHVLAQLRATSFNDMYVRNGSIRNDGRMVHDMYLLRIKAPVACAEPWDYYELDRTFGGGL